jgi:hypothetical protein
MVCSCIWCRMAENGRSLLWRWTWCRGVCNSGGKLWCVRWLPLSVSLYAARAASVFRQLTLARYMCILLFTDDAADASALRPAHPMLTSYASYVASTTGSARPSSTSTYTGIKTIMPFGPNYPWRRSSTCAATNWQKKQSRGIAFSDGTHDPRQQLLPREAAAVFIGGVKQTSEVGDNLRFHAGSIEARRFYTHELGWSDDAFQAVDWPSLDATLKSKPKMFHVWLCK